MSKVIIGLTGYAGSGKSTIATYLCQDHGFVELSLAGPLKNAARCLGWNGEKDGTGRQFLQLLGTEAIQGTFGKEFWCHLLYKQVEALTETGHDKFVISDVRFIHEARYLRTKFPQDVVMVVRVNRPSVSPHNNHRSETELDLIWPDETIYNADGHLDDLYAQASNIAVDAIGKLEERR